MKKFSLNGFEMTSKMTVRLLAFSAAVMHLVFLLLFMKFRVSVLMYFNIGSVVFYISIGIVSLLKNDHSKKMMLFLMLMFFEIVIHATLCTIFLGVDVFFIIYPLIALPICVYYLFFYCKRSTFLKAVIFFTTATVVITAATVAVSEFFGGSLPTNIAVLSRKEKTVFRTVNIFFSAVVLYAFTMIFYLEMTRLMDKLRQSTDKLQYTATHDALTGLTNRRSFWDYFDAISRDGKHYNIAMGDLDSFKKINDTYGHGCGDLVLKSVAEIINESTEEDEIACRWGGEEMVVVFTGERGDALTRLEEIRRRIESLSLNYEGLNVHVTMTFGFADSEEIQRAISENEINDAVEQPSLRMGIESLISMADKRLYIGKDRGKNVVVDK